MHALMRDQCARLLSQNIPDFVGGRLSFASCDRSVQLVSGEGKCEGDQLFAPVLW